MRIRTYLLLLFCALVIAGTYGAVHDQFTFTVSDEYFTKLKFQQFHFLYDALPDRMRVAAIGWLATWWMGIPVWLLVGSFGFMHRTPRTMLTRTLKAYAVVAGVALLTGLYGLAIGWYWADPETADGYRNPTTALLEHPRHFMAVAYMHTLSYLGGLLGSIAGIYFQFRQRDKRPVREAQPGLTKPAEIDFHDAFLESQISSMNLYRCLIEERDDDEPFYQTYWTKAPDIGTALEQVLASARGNGLGKPIPSIIDPCDIDSVDGHVLPDKSATTFWSQGRVFFGPGEPGFQIPYGVIGASGEGGQDLDEIQRGYTIETNEEGMNTLSVNVDEADMPTLYETLLRAQPLYQVFWYRLHEHWEDGTDHFLVNEALSTPASILGHLSENRIDSLLNGYISLTAYLEEGATNLNLSEHKRIVIHTLSAGILELYQNLLDASGYSRKDDLISVDGEIHHWHYRHPESRDRAELVKHLHSLGFTDWNR